jgi:hypothetical protein
MSDKRESGGTPKIGAGHLQAFARQGFAEIRNALYSDSNVAQRFAEPGIYGTAVPSEVAAERQADTQERSIPDRVNDAKQEPEPARESREGPGMERD